MADASSPAAGYRPHGAKFITCKNTRQVGRPTPITEQFVKQPSTTGVLGDILSNMDSQAVAAEPHYLLEDVFKLSGVPTVTFVEPVEFERLVVALRTAGRAS